MYFFRNGFYVACKVKDLKRELAKIGGPSQKLKECIRLNLN